MQHLLSKVIYIDLFLPLRTFAKIYEGGFRFAYDILSLVKVTSDPKMIFDSSGRYPVHFVCKYLFE